MTVSILARALVRWQHAAGPFWPYICAAPFLSTADAETLARRVWAHGEADTGDRARREPGSHRALVDRLVGPAETGGSQTGMGTMGMGGKSGGALAVILADLPPEPLLAAAPLLVERGWYVVPVIQRWIATPAVLPCRRLLERLLLGARCIRRPSEPRGLFLVADGERTGRPGYPATVTGQSFDNRYEYQICRFPSIDVLRSQNVGRVRWLTRGGVVASDLLPYQEALLRAGIAVEVRTWPPPA